MRRKLLTGAQEHVLYTLVRLCADRPQRLKLPLLAQKAGVHRNTAKLAVRILAAEGIIRASRKNEDGPDAVWEIEITPRARVLAASLALSNEHGLLPVSQ